MRLAFPLLFFTGFAAAQSHPTWWTNAPPEATAIVGIDWRIARTSPFAEPIEAELWGDLALPDLPSLHNARQIIISSPDLLVIITGSFPASVLQAEARAFKPTTYRGVDMWFAREKGALSLARLSDQLVLVGEPRTLEMTVDRTLGFSKDYSPLLSRAAKFAQKDLWVVASRLPDDLANRFVPLDADADGFEGSISLKSGLELDAIVSASSEEAANRTADSLRKAVPTMPMIVRGLQISVEDSSVLLSLEATREQVLSAIRQPDPVVPPPETIKVETPVKVQQVPVEKVVQTLEKPVEKPAEKPVQKVLETPPAPEKPQVIRIIGLDDGPREIVLPPSKPDKP